jgi:hypothetical protein
VLVALAACSRPAGTGGDRPPAADPTAETANRGQGAGWLPPVRLGTLAPEVDESSGLAASRRNPGRLWTHNDSGDGPFIYCLAPSGEPCGTWRVTGAAARDWEDMAVGPGPVAGTDYLYIGDIGDNLADQAQMTVYRVPEPAVGDGPPPAGGSAPLPTEAAEAIRLRYPDGPRDAEALMVHPTTGDLYIVSKEAGPNVYVARAPLSTTGTTTLERVATLGISGGDLFTLVTGGDISPDGTRVALSTYLEGVELTLPAGASSFDAVWSASPQPVDLGLRPQGEAVAYRLDGQALLATSESRGGAAAPIFETVRR